MSCSRSRASGSLIPAAAPAASCSPPTTTSQSSHELDRDQKRFLRDEAFCGTEIVDNTARLCAMNLFLHGIGSSRA